MGFGSVGARGRVGRVGVAARIGTKRHGAGWGGWAETRGGRGVSG